MLVLRAVMKLTLSLGMFEIRVMFCCSGLMILPMVELGHKYPHLVLLFMFCCECKRKSVIFVCR